VGFFLFISNHKALDWQSLTKPFFARTDFMPVDPEKLALLTLQLIRGLGPRLTAALLKRFGSARAVMRASSDELRQIPHIGDKLAYDLQKAMQEADVLSELDLIAQHGVQLLALGSVDYPAHLAEIYDPPHLLYVKGSLVPADAKAVAVVGSRHCTGYGQRMAERLGRGLAQRGYTIISGLARGIDGAAHRGSLSGGGRTLAVLAGGLAKVYPPEHKDLASEIEKAGALLSEASMKMEHLADLFPPRNRLISGLARGVVIVEAAERSGALITARQAADQGRAVFAIPGPVDSASSAGTNLLLRQGAILVRSAEDIIEELEGVAAATNPTPLQPPPGLDESQLRLWELLKEQPKHADELARLLNRPIHEVTGALMMLEMKKVVKRLPGNRYERC
jgi:DNA processing protein